MPAPIEFQIKILGGAAADLNKTADGFTRTDKEAHKAAEGVKFFEGETGKLSQTVAGLTFNLNSLHAGGPMVTFDLAEGLRAAYEFGERLVDKIVELGKEALHVVGEVEDIGFALRANLGEKGAEDVERLADTFERLTRFDGSDVKKAILPLTELGVTDVKLLDSLATASADIAARRDSGVEGFKQYLSAFGEIAVSGGEKMKGSLKALGIMPREYYAQLGAYLKASTKDAEALAKAGKVSNDVLLSVAVSTIAAREGGKGIGSAAVESATTLGGVLTRLGNLPENLMERLAGTPAIEKASRLLQGVLDRLAGPEGAQLMQTFAGAMERALDKVRVEDVVSALRGMLVVVEKIAEAAGKIAGAIGQVGRNQAAYDKLQEEGGVKGFVAGIPFLRMAVLNVEEEDQALQAREKGIVIGQNYADGYAEGVAYNSPAAVDAAIKLVNASHKAASGPEGLDAHSPSRKAMQLGQWYAQGLAEGMDSEADRLSVVATRTIAQTVEARPGIGAAGGGNTTNVYAEIVVQGANRDERSIAQEVRVEIFKLVEQAQLSMGDTP